MSADPIESPRLDPPASAHYRVPPRLGAWEGDNERHGDMFPTFSPAQIAELTTLGVERTYPPGACVWDVGDRTSDFHVVLDGTLEILRRDPFGAETAIATHTVGRFSGETTMLSGRARMVAARAGSRRGSPSWKRNCAAPR